MSSDDESKSPIPVPSSMSSSRATLRINKDMRIPTVKLDNIEILTGHENYDDWADQVTIVLDAMQLSEIVIEGKDLPDSADEDEKPVLKTLRSQALLVLIQLLSKPIMKIVAKKRDPHAIWKYLRETYRRDTAFSFVQQIMTFTSLPSSYDPSEPRAISEFIDRCETEWARLQSLTDGSNDSDTYRTKFREFLEEDKAKRDFLLGFLVKHHENVVDNLTAKDSLSYSDVVMKLHSLSCYSDTSIAYKASRPNERDRDTDREKKDRDTDHEKKECNYCKAHKLGNPQGHTWKDCRKLKAKQDAERKTEDSSDGKKKTKDQATHVVREDSDNNSDSDTHHALTSYTVRNPSVFYNWVFDTGASSHMTFDKGLFETLSPHHGYVKIGNGKRLRISGKGTCRMLCQLPDGSVSQNRLTEVLCVPELDVSLYSWRATRKKKGFLMIDDGVHGIEVRKDEQLVLWADPSVGNLFYIPETSTSACVASTSSSYQHWHAAFGHVAPSSLRHRNFYVDGNLIPLPPAEFHCEPCALAKSTHKVPTPITLRSATRKLELVHSDLSGKFSVPSYGNKRYYMTLVDDYTRATWVYFLKHKSDATAVIKDFVIMCERQGHGKVLRFRTDNGGEYVNHETEVFFKETGILHEPTPQYSHESNGVAERLNRTLKTMARCMMNDIDDQRLWAEAIQTAVYLKNRLSHSAIQDQTPYEAFRGEKPSIQHLQPFGRTCYVHIPVETRPPASTLLPRAEKGIFVGYTDSVHLFRVFVPSRKIIRVSRDVRFSPTAITPTAITPNSEGVYLTPLRSDITVSLEREPEDANVLSPPCQVDHVQVEPIEKPAYKEPRPAALPDHLEPQAPNAHRTRVTGRDIQPP
jgi:transposase InsO family protein